MTASSRDVNLPGEPGPPGTPVRRWVHSDIGIAVGIVAFCAVVYGVTMTFPRMPTAMQSMGMGPEVFPRLLLGLLVLLAGVLALLSRGKADAPREPIPAMVYWTALAMVAFMGVLWLAGMPVAMVLGYVGIGALWGERRWALLVGSGAALSAAIYFMFTRGFGVPLPRGLVGDWLF
jgi:putative tricarboxylic transport membrane protein